MKAENLTEEVIEQIAEINKEIAILHQKVKHDYEDLLKEVEYRRSLGEDI